MQDDLDMTNPTPDALLPCPFCGGGNIAYVTNGDREWTTCDDCLSEGPDAATQDEALAAWNRRAGQSHDAGLLAALEAAWQQSVKMRNAAKLVGPYPNDPAKTKIWQRSMYHAGKDLQNVLKPARAAIAAAKGA